MACEYGFRAPAFALRAPARPGMTTAQCVSLRFTYCALVIARLVILGCSERKALPRTAIRGRAAVDRIDCALSRFWLLRSEIVVSVFIGPGWLPERMVRLTRQGRPR